MSWVFIFFDHALHCSPHELGYIEGCSSIVAAPACSPLHVQTNVVKILRIYLRALMLPKFWVTGVKHVASLLTKWITVLVLWRIKLCQSLQLTPDTPSPISKYSHTHTHTSSTQLHSQIDLMALGMKRTWLVMRSLTYRPSSARSAAHQEGQTHQDPACRTSRRLTQTYGPLPGSSSRPAARRRGRPVSWPSSSTPFWPPSKPFRLLCARQAWPTCKYWGTGIGLLGTSDIRTVYTPLHYWLILSDILYIYTD